MSRLQVLGSSRVARLLCGLTTLGVAAGIAGSALAGTGAGWQRELWAAPPDSPAASLLLTDSQLAAALVQDEEEDVPHGALMLDEADDPAPRRWWPVALSAVIPGLGEVVTGHRRGYFFLAGDAASWYAVKHFSDKGNDKEDEYEAFALAHWSEAEWTAALATGEMEPYFGHEAGSTPEDVPLYVSREEDEREWFENLGKWDVFYWGWDDGFPSGNLPEDFSPIYQTPNRKHYVDMRGESNDAFSNRDKFLTLNLITRVVSVLDVAYLEGFIGGRYKNEAKQAFSATGAEALAQELAARELDPRLSLYLAPRGLDETRLGLRVSY